MTNEEIKALKDACASVWMLLSDTHNPELRKIADECRAALEPSYNRDLEILRRHGRGR